MPAYVAIYVALYLGIELWGFVVAVRDRRNGRWIGLRFFAEIFVVATALAYWFAPLRPLLAPYAAAMFWIGALGIVAMIAMELPKQLSDQTDSNAEALVAALLTLALTITISAPMFIWSYRFAIEGSIAAGS
ncbi:MAG: hypothetical protein NVS9B10_07480 [Nevskia sp.]